MAHSSPICPPNYLPRRSNLNTRSWGYCRKGNLSQICSAVIVSCFTIAKIRMGLEYLSSGVAGLVRRKLNITDQPEDAREVLVEEARLEQLRTERKNQQIEQNAKDLGLLQAVMKGSHLNTSTAAVNGSASAIDESAHASEIGPPLGPSSIVRTYESAHRTLAEPFRGLRRSKSKKQANRDSHEIPVMRADIAEGALAVEGSDSEDDDIEDDAFKHPSTYKATPVIWIPRDDLGLSAHLLDELKSAGVYASDIGAFIDLKGNVDVTRNPPDQEWTGGNDI